jgi:Resolvase, N terminal domain
MILRPTRCRRPGSLGGSTLVHAARAGRFDVLLVYRVDRLSRSIRGLSDILTLLDRSGAAVPKPPRRDPADRPPST